MFNEKNNNFIEQKEKPEFLYHGSDTPDISEFEPRRRYTPGGGENIPERVYASDNPGFSVAHSFPWSSNEGFELSVENGKVLFRVPRKYKSRLEQNVFLYKIPSVQFELTKEETTGHTFHSESKVKPIETQTFENVQQGIEYFGGTVEYYDE